MTVDEQQDYAASHLPVTTSSCLVTSSLSTNTLTPQTQKWGNWCMFQEMVGFDGSDSPNDSVLQDRVVNAGPIGDIWWW